jgi:predicted transcriptional regulator
VLSHSERNLVKFVAKLSPWLAPLPSGFFVARASMKHLIIPMPVAIAVGVIIELLGIASVHTWLWLFDWNTNKRKSDPDAPTSYAAFLGAVYMVTTIGLTVVLEVRPDLSTFAPALFPLLAIVGAINLAMVAQQEQREITVNRERRERQEKRLSLDSVNRVSSVQNDNVHLSPLTKMDTRFSTANAARKRRRDRILNNIIEIIENHPEIGITELARQIGRSRTTVYKYLEELEQSGQINRNGGDERVQVYESNNIDLEQP